MTTDLLGSDLLRNTDDPDIEWAERFMPLLATTVARHSDVFDGTRVGICLHIEPKTAVLCRLLQRHGAQVTIAGNLGTSDTETVNALRRDGITVVGERTDLQAQHERSLDAVLASDPELILDNGGELIERLVKAGVPASFRGATEETTTGGFRIRALNEPLNFPVIVINDSPLKLIVENEFGVGQSIVQGYMNVTNSMLPGARAVVVGYGPCGKGVADTLRALGARVKVADTNPIRLLDAIMNGHTVGDLHDLVGDAEVIFLATGHAGVLGERELANLRSGVMLVGVGHEAWEVDIPALAAQAKQKANLSGKLADIDARVVYTLGDGREVVVIHGTKMVNLVGAKGNPIQTLDIGLALQTASLAAIARGEVDFVGAYGVPDNINHEIASAWVEIVK
jgi:adenosylhomocysteinase